MLTSLGFYRRKPGISHEEFSRHWREVHGPLIRNHPDGPRLMRRYVQHHIEPGFGFPGTIPMEFDGFSETWWDGVEGRQQFFANPYFKDVIIPDEFNFIDMSVTRVLMFDKQVVQIGEDVAPRIFPK